MRHCPGCKAIINPKWNACLACGYVFADSLINRYVKSAILGRVVKMVLDPNTPDQVVFDGATYTMAELTSLISRKISRDGLQEIHRVKQAFEGTVVNS